jgi:Ca-activated chloride channel family protein
MNPQNPHDAARQGKRVRGFAGAGLAAFALVLIIGTIFWPHFWLTADQQGDLLLERKAFSQAAKTYADPWRIGAAQYRSGDFGAAARSFARVSGAAGAFDEGNAWLMHGQYDRAIACYGRALHFRPDWKPAVENRALAAARKAKLDASSENREKEQTDAYTPDKLVFDQKGGEKRKEPLDLNGERLTEEAMRAAWLRRVQTTPGDFLQAKFAYQAAHTVEGRTEKGEER